MIGLHSRAKSSSLSPGRNCQLQLRTFCLIAFAALLIIAGVEVWLEGGC